METLDNEKKKLTKTIERQEKRKLKQKQRSKHPILKGLGMFGLIGWTIVAPTLLGTFFGVWLDEKYPSLHSWTLTFLITGLFLGCAGAWYILSKEKNDMQKEEEKLNG
jgi:ATP synthase protein I